MAPTAIGIGISPCFGGGSGGGGAPASGSEIEWDDSVAMEWDDGVSIEWDD